MCATMLMCALLAIATTRHFAATTMLLRWFRLVFLVTGLTAANGLNSLRLGSGASARWAGQAGGSAYCSFLQ